MKKARRVLRSLICVLLLVVSLVTSAAVANATSDYDNVVTLTNQLRLEQNSSHGSGQADIANTWYSIFSDCAKWTSDSSSYSISCSVANAALSTTRDHGYGLAVVQRIAKMELSIGNVNVYPGDKYVSIIFNPETDANGIFRVGVYGEHEYHLTGSSFTYGFNLALSNDPNNPQAVVASGARSTGLASYTQVAETDEQPYWSSNVYFSNAPTFYPEGYEGLVIPTASPAVKYAALGDSYSSGEGNAPFEVGTDVSNVNGCHRSPRAYPRLLENDLDLGATAFVACSGAKASNIAGSGQWNEPAEQESITADTKLVTMSIGGNDMPFDAFARQCVTPGINSTCDGQAYQDALAGIVNNVIPNVQSMLQTLSAHMTAAGSEATVLVVGYPQLVPDTWVSNTAGCWWLQPQELPAIRQVTNSLNTAIKNEVEAVGGKFKFVSATEIGSPFAGHELCRDVSDTASEYFNNYDSSAPEAFTFHPNELGQAAYAQLIKAYLSQHPLS